MIKISRTGRNRYGSEEILCKNSRLQTVFADGFEQLVHGALQH